MPRRKSKDAERVAFIAPLGNRALYEEVPALEGLPVDSWIRETLSREAARVLAANERDSREVPPARAGSLDARAGARRAGARRPAARR